MKKFIDFINESSIINFSFTYDGNIIKFEETTKKEIFIEVIDWLSSLGYLFDNSSNQTYYPNIVDSIPIGSRVTHWYKIPSINKYIDINFIKQFQSLISLLKDFGIDKNTIQFDIAGKGENLDVEDQTPNDQTSNSEDGKPKFYAKNPLKYNFRISDTKSWAVYR